MQYYKHTQTGQVYGADERTRPPASFYESRVGDNGKPEFVKVAAPKGRKATSAKGDTKAPDSGQENGDGGQGDGDGGQGDGDGSEKGGD
ncbi:hypothetical protein FZ103_00265 [Streptomonospora sp. PA3]|uniref:hypothetical protein n=1 Tax=Streptomonospora sp. PA3 TaxID=2607326 RepID=UPI0012DC288B|nr:hypothetical protein [Streptomonospora sp. PA3]MUL39627.1 hypothetical protein [Streptomonospora sp. PA3]